MRSGPRSTTWSSRLSSLLNPYWQTTWTERHVTVICALRCLASTSLLTRTWNRGSLKSIHYPVLHKVPISTKKLRLLWWRTFSVQSVLSRTIKRSLSALRWTQGGIASPESNLTLVLRLPRRKRSFKRMLLATRTTLETSISRIRGSKRTNEGIKAGTHTWWKTKITKNTLPTKMRRKRKKKKTWPGHRPSLTWRRVSQTMWLVRSGVWKS